MIGVAKKSTGKTNFRVRIFRASTGKWENPGAWWKTKQFLREARIYAANFFRARQGFASVVTDVGEQWIVDKMQETVQTTPDWVGWGTGAGTAAEEDTTLFTEASEARVQGTMSQPTADTLRVVATITADGAKTITNAGTFTASSGGTLIVKGDFTGIVLALGDKIEFTINLQIT